MRKLSGHHFWPDDISILDDALIDVHKLLTPGQITDSYLLGLAQSHGGFLATFDRRFLVSAVKGGIEALHIIADYAR
jgi:predicted nucleic acid-binding protein